MTGDILNHLWQSTLFTVAAGLLTLALRRNQAHIRYWLWFSASVKFFVPFTLLITFGSQLEWAPTAQQITPPALSSAMGQISQPFTDFSLAAEPTALSTRGAAGPFMDAILALLWTSGAFALALTRFRLWRRVRAVLRTSTRCHVAGIPTGVDVRSTPTLMEPGVVGWWRPVLLLPRRIEDHLTPQQLDAIIAHELCHVRRRDNLTSTIHMVVEAVFWFHPLVWWIGARLIEERERACDEEVLRLGGDPQIYAEGILNVCKRYAEAPLVCVSGVSGSNLRKRLEAIMTNRVGRRLNVGTKIALAVAAMTVPILPMVVGAMSPAQVREESAPRFEVASIKLNTTATIPLSAVHLAFLRAAGAGNAKNGRFWMQGDLAATPLSVLIQLAYNVNSLQLDGGPSWVRSDRYEVDARAEGSATFEQMRPMLQSLLADRFKLTLRRETRQLPVYELLPDRVGLKIMPMKEGSCLPADQAIPFGPLTTCGGLRRQRTPERHVLEALGIPMTKLAELLSDDLGRVVIDKTGSTSLFSFRLEFAPVALQVAPADSSVPPLSGALQEQLGLRLEATRAPVEVLVIESVERPSPN